MPEVAPWLLAVSVLRGKMNRSQSKPILWTLVSWLTIVAVSLALAMAQASSSSSSAPAKPAAPVGSSATAPASSGTAPPATKAEAPSAQEIAASKSSNKVWVNTETGVYHKGGRWYGKTKKGKFLTEAEVKAAGYKAAKRD